MSIGEAVSAVATSLRSQPGLLAILLVSCVWAGLTYLAVQNRDIRAHEEKIAIIERCWPKPDVRPGPVSGADPDAGPTADLQLRTGPAILLPALLGAAEVQEPGHAATAEARIWRTP